MKTRFKFIYGFIAVVLAGFVMTSCEKESEGVSASIFYPVITITGDEEVILNVGDSYTDEGAVATSGDETLELTTTGSVDTSTPGVYYITYSAKIMESGIEITQTASRKIFVVLGAASPDISGVYKIIHATATSTLTITKTGERTYYASDTWWQANAIPVSFADIGNGEYLMYPDVGSSVYGDFTGDITYDFVNDRIRFDMIFISGNTGTTFNWEWQKQ